MPEPVRFFFDPLCPWAYQTSRWIRRLSELDVVDVSWGLFSLELANDGNAESVAKGHARSAPALRTLELARRRGGDAAVDRLYRELGALVHVEGEPIDEPKTVQVALERADLDPELLDAALADEGTWSAVADEHRGLVERTRSFGVPTIVLDGGEGPAIFGPVISEVPGDDDAVQLWHHVAWLTRCETFSELKRERTTDPDLESVRQFRRRLAEERDDS